MFFRIFVFSIITLLSSSLIYSQDVEQIVKIIKENNSREKIKTLYVETKADFMGMEMTMKRWIKDTKTRVDNSFMGQEVTVVITPDGGWINQNGTISDFPPEQIPLVEAQLKSQDPTNTFPIDDDITFELEGKVKIEGQPCLNILAKDTQGNKSNIYVDEKNYRTIKIVSDQEMNGDMKKIEMQFFDYNNYAGVQLPKKVLINVDGQKYGEMNNVVIEVNKPIEDSIFEKK